MIMNIDDLAAKVQAVGNRLGMSFQANRNNVAFELRQMKKDDYKRQREAQAISLRYEEGLLMKEVGEKMGISESYAGNLIQAGIAHLVVILSKKARILKGENT